MTLILILFALPVSLLWGARKQSLIAVGPARTWRTYSRQSALAVAACSMFLELIFLFSYFHSGGSPHGMMPSLGLWKTVGPIAGWSFVASLVLLVFGKGQWRLRMLPWAVSYIVVVYAIFMLERD